MRPLNDHGFTLLETLITLAIFIVGATFAISAIMDMGKKSSVMAEARQLKDKLIQARVEAIRLNEWVTVEYRQANNDYVIFVDSNPPDYTFDGAEEVISQVNLTSSVYDIDKGGGDGISIAAGNVVTWAPRGLSFSFNGGLSNGSVFLKGNEAGYQITISQAGNVRIQDY